MNLFELDTLMLKKVLKNKKQLNYTYSYSPLPKCLVTLCYACREKHKINHDAPSNYYDRGCNKAFSDTRTFIIAYDSEPNFKEKTNRYFVPQSTLSSTQPFDIVSTSGFIYV